MTFSASRKPDVTGNGQDVIEILCTYGPLEFRAQEHHLHVGSFWGQLGRLLAEDPAHRDQRGRQAYDRYSAHAGGVSAISGQRLPTWEGTTEEIREHWRHAATG